METAEKNHDLSAMIAEIEEHKDFSGVIWARVAGNQLLAEAYGYANRPNARPNTIDTRFGIASGCKAFTAVAICQLVEQGKFSFDSLLKDCLDIEFPNFDPRVSVHHLLTHTSGVPDYFDEEVMDDFEILWREKPTYTIRGPKDFLSFFQDEAMKFEPGARFSYNNAGFILLGLIVEQHSGMAFTDYIEQHVFKPASMLDSGYFAMDQLPARTAYGYLKNADGTWRNNIFSVPIIGGPDGGAYTTAADLAKFWEALFGHKLLQAQTTQCMLTPQANEEKDSAYGYGVWIKLQAEQVLEHYVVGGDPGVACISEHFAQRDAVLTMLGNTDDDAAWKICGIVRDYIKSH